MVDRGERVRDAKLLAHTHDAAGGKLLPVVRHGGPGRPIPEYPRLVKRHSCELSVDVSQGNHSCYLQEPVSDYEQEALALCRLRQPP